MLSLECIQQPYRNTFYLFWIMQQVSLYCLLLITPSPSPGPFMPFAYLLVVSNTINTVHCYATYQIQNSDNKQNSSRKGPVHNTCPVRCLPCTRPIVTGQVGQVLTWPLFLVVSHPHTKLIDYVWCTQIKLWVYNIFYWKHTHIMHRKL